MTSLERIWHAAFRRSGLERRLALVLTICAIVAGIATYAVTSRAAADGAGVGTLLILLNLDLILLLLLAVVVARRLVRLVMERRQGSAGSRLHVRLAALFGFLAATPAIVVAVFSVVFLSSGLEHWFSTRVTAALDNSLAVAEAYLAEHREVIRADAVAMAADLEREGPALFESPGYLRHFVVAQAALRALPEAVVFDAAGNVLAYSGLGLAIELESLPADVVQRAERGEVVTMTNESDDRVRAVLRLGSLPDIYLSVGRFVDPMVLGFMERTQELVAAHHRVLSERTGIQVTSALIFGVVALLLLLAAIWVGLNLADRLARPIGRLIEAADRVRRGDLGVRVPVPDVEDELGSLARAFNRMTDQLESQRNELISTNQQLDERRRFIETVLAGVTAGVVGLDRERRVLLANRSALEMLAPDADSPGDVPIEALFPEVVPLFERLAEAPHDTARDQLTVRRGMRERVLVVRLAAQTDDGWITGFVLTFDDLTELLSAQRQAAWAEVARRIAHEIKNPLTPIRLSAERLGRRFQAQVKEEDRAGFARAVTTIVQQVDTIGRLVTEFSAFARMPAPTIRPASVAEIVRDAVHLQQGAGSGIEILAELPAGDDLVAPCDAEKLGQVLTNLVQNACNALSEQPDRPATPPRILVRAARRETWVVVEVEDNGPGFPAGERERLFEPYVTTRAKGTGLGLAIVKKIMEEHRGTVDLENAAHGGAVVRLWLPLAPLGQARPGRETAERERSERSTVA